MKAEKEKMDREKEFMKMEMEKMEIEKKKMSDREDDLRAKGRILKTLYEDFKKEKIKEDVLEESTLHIPLKDGEIAGDPCFEKVASKKHECFGSDYVCGHIKITHVGKLHVTSWMNKSSRRAITFDAYGSESDSEPPTKVARRQ